MGQANCTGPREGKQFIEALQQERAQRANKAPILAEQAPRSSILSDAANDNPQSPPLNFSPRDSDIPMPGSPSYRGSVYSKKEFSNPYAKVGDDKAQKDPNAKPPEPGVGGFMNSARPSPSVHSSLSRTSLNSAPSIAATTRSVSRSSLTSSVSRESISGGFQKLPPGKKVITHDNLAPQIAANDRDRVQEDFETAYVAPSVIKGPRYLTHTASSVLHSKTHVLDKVRQAVKHDVARKSVVDPQDVAVSHASHTPHPQRRRSSIRKYKRKHARSKSLPAARHNMFHGYGVHMDLEVDM